MTVFTVSIEVNAALTLKTFEKSYQLQTLEL